MDILFAHMKEKWELTQKPSSFEVIQASKPPVKPEGTVEIWNNKYKRVADIHPYPWQHYLFDNFEIKFIAVCVR